MRLLKLQGNENGYCNVENINPTYRCCSKWLQGRKWNAQAPKCA